MNYLRVTDQVSKGRKKVFGNKFTSNQAESHQKNFKWERAQRLYEKTLGDRKYNAEMAT